MRYSLKEAFEDFPMDSDWGEFWMILANFLDDFKRDNNAGRLLDEVKEMDVRMGAFLAATADKLSVDSGYEIPAWTLKRKYYLEEPYFPSNAKGELRIFILRECPLEFKVRNLFVLENVLRGC